MKVKHLVIATAAVVVALAAAALGLMSSPGAGVAQSADTRGSALLAPEAGLGVQLRSYIRPLYHRFHAASANQDDVDRINQARADRFADKPAGDGIKGGAVHYGHGPDGLSSDAATVGYSHKH